MVINCLKCLNSACCKLEVTVNQTEYEYFKTLNLDSIFKTRTEMFLEKNPSYKNRAIYFDNMYRDNFAILKRGEDGYCEMLDQKSMKCSIYDNRPSKCKNYTTDRCKNIRELCQ